MNLPRSLIGKRVLNVHRQDADSPQAHRDAYKGTVLDVQAGVNGTVRVQFDGLEFPSLMARQDLALCGQWPGPGSRLSELRP